MKHFVELAAVGADPNPPDAGGTVDALSRIGYSLEQALADIIDNSVDAGAADILIRFYRDAKLVRRIVIVDNGSGMTDDVLREAMRFGARQAHKRSDLGKYGIGLKTASLSQCDNFSVISLTDENQLCARRWTRASVTENWMCERLDLRNAESLLLQFQLVIDLGKSGTLVVWDHLDHNPIGVKGRQLSALMKKLDVHLGLTFHRYLDAEMLRIRMDSFNIDTGNTGPEYTVSPLDPFSYRHTGHTDYPKEFHAKLPSQPMLKLQAHIWPPHSSGTGYELGGGNVASRQGFYFYRNDRLIQAGGWNGFRGEAEPHSSLARVSVDLPPEMDSIFRLKVQKSGLDAPPAFVEAIREARSGTKPFTEYVAEAVEVYRTTRTPGAAPAVSQPCEGFPMALRAWADQAIGEAARKHPVTLQWQELPETEVFQIAAIEGVLSLNSRYRERLSAENGASIVEALLYLLLQNDLNPDLPSKTGTLAITSLNELLYNLLKIHE